jgi:hypothetical protein
MKRAVLLLCLCLAGCSSMSVFQSPGVLPKGESETGIGGSFITGEDGTFIVNLELHTRRGLGKNWEAGAKLFGIPGLSGGVMGEIKYQLMTQPFLLSADLGTSCLLTNDLIYFDSFPMLIMGDERMYGGYRGIYRNGANDDLKLQFQSYLHGVFIGYKLGHGPYFRPEFHYYFKDLKGGYIILGLGFQFY